MFYHAFLELDGANMVSILSFDSCSLEYLLHDRFEEQFSSQYPIFYRNKIQKGKVYSYHGQDCGNNYFYRSAIDNALKNNQIRAINLMIDYIVKY